MNRIRASLSVVARNSTAFGLKQPHLERTRLCQLTDAELDPGYLQQRTALRELVGQLAKPKVPPAQGLPCYCMLRICGS